MTAIFFGFTIIANWIASVRNSCKASKWIYTRYFKAPAGATGLKFLLSITKVVASCELGLKFIIGLSFLAKCRSLWTLG